jgi:hypothetical protein
VIHTLGAEISEKLTVNIAESRAESGVENQNTVFVLCFFAETIRVAN